MKKLSTYNQFLLNQHLKKKNDARKEAEKAELDNIKMTDAEIKDVLIQIDADKYDVLKNLPICKKLQKMRLIRAGRGVEIASSFSSVFYLTQKGKEFIKA